MEKVDMRTPLKRGVNKKRLRKLMGVGGEVPFIQGEISL